MLLSSQVKKQLVTSARHHLFSSWNFLSCSTQMQKLPDWVSFIFELSLDDSFWRWDEFYETEPKAECLRMPIIQSRFQPEKKS